MAGGGGQWAPPEDSEHAGGLRLAGGLFTVLPFRPVSVLTRQDAVRAVRWMPWLGLLMGALAGTVAGVVGWLGASPLLCAALGVGLVESMTGFLHLDGLADTSDGLGSRRDTQAALAIMKGNDIGPMGVASVVLVLLVDVAAAASPGDFQTTAALLLLAPMVGRLACLWACGRWVPNARAGGFGALFAGVTTPLDAAAQLAAVLVLAAGLGWGLAAGAGALVLASAVLAGLTLAQLCQRYLVRRFGGLTGDMLGALIELTTLGFLVVAGVWLA